MTSDHRRILMYGVVEVCNKCVNSFGYNVPWELAEHARHIVQGKEAQR